MSVKNEHCFTGKARQYILIPCMIIHSQSLQQFHVDSKSSSARN